MITTFNSFFLNKINKKKKIEVIEYFRALSVVAVIFFHIDSNLLKNGYLGVDIFFVISGYVITSSIYKYKNLNLISIISNFYIKRIKRIYPVLIIVLSITFIIFILLNISENKHLLIYSFITAVFGISNLFFYKIKNDYFLANDVNPFTHTWSLGIEEQFYLFFPFIFFFICNLKKIYFYLILFFIIILNFLFIENNYFNFYFSLLRYSEIFLGVLIFFIKKKITPPKLNKNYFYILLFFLISLFFIKFNLIYYNIILACFLFTLILLFFDQLKFLENKFTISLYNTGQISYSLYLWHFPIIIISKFFFSNYFFQILIIFFLTFIASLVTYHYVEQKFLKSKRFENLLTKYYKFIIIFAIVILSAGYLHKTKINNFIKYIYLVTGGDSKFIKYSSKNTHYTQYEVNGNFNKNCSLNEYKSYDNLLSNCLYKKSKNNNEIIFMFGDSTASSNLPLIHLAYPNSSIYKINSPLALLGIFPQQFNDTDSQNIKKLIYQNKLNHNLLRKFSKSDHKKIIIISNLSSIYLRGDHIIYDEYLKMIPLKKIDKVIENNIKKLISNYGKNYQIIFINENLTPQLKLRECFQVIKIENNCDLKNLKYFEGKRLRFSKILENIKSNFSQISILDPLKKICNNKTQKCDFFFNKESAYVADGRHFTLEASRYLSKYFNLMLY